jgi:chromosome segregation ATPase
MEAVKHKMDALVTEKKKLIESANKCEEEMKIYKGKGDETDKGIRSVEKLISKAEESLDDTMTANVTAAERLEEAETTASHAELEVSALSRKIRLLEDEQSKVDERYKETVSKLADYETALEENERERKIHEAKSFSIEEKLELMGAQLEEATGIAEEADRKYEEVARKLRIVEGDLERMVDKSEEFENKVKDSEMQISEHNEQLKKMEDLCGKNAEKEDNYDNTVRSLSEKLKNAETGAEFGERTVEKLERTIDTLQEQLYQEKLAFKELSMKLDKTLQDMMHLAEEC